jgi:hypothetical protein
MFDTLKYVKLLEQAGLSRELAETHVQVLVEVMDNQLATGEDLRNMGLLMKADIQDFRAEMRAEFQKFKSGMSAEFQEFKSGMSAEIQEFKSGMSAEFQEFKSEVRTDLREFRHELDVREKRMMIKLGAMMSVTLGIALTLSHLLR